MIYTIADLVAYARERDTRLEDTDKYTTAKMEELVEEAFAIMQDMRPIFSTTETYDLEQNVVTDALTEIEIVLQREPQSIRSLVDYDDVYFEYEITANNHIIMRVTSNKVQPDTDYKVTVKYFYYPLMPLTTIELSVDSYRLLRETIGVAICAHLRDYEQEQVHRNKAKVMAQESSYDLEKDLLAFPEERLWDNSWV